MTTKILAPSETLSEIHFEICGEGFCCGVYEMGNFVFAEPKHWTSQGYVPNPNVKKLPAKEQFEAFVEKARQGLWEEVSGNTFGDKEDDGYYYLQTSLIATTADFAALVEQFKKHKWAGDEFVNHNTKNTVYLFRKKFKFSALKRDFDNDDYSW